MLGTQAVILYVVEIVGVGGVATAANLGRPRVAQNFRGKRKRKATRRGGLLSLVGKKVMPTVTPPQSKQRCTSHRQDKQIPSRAQTWGHVVTHLQEKCVRRMRRVRHLKRRVEGREQGALGRTATVVLLSFRADSLLFCRGGVARVRYRQQAYQQATGDRRLR